MRASKQDHAQGSGEGCEYQAEAQVDIEGTVCCGCSKYCDQEITAFKIKTIHDLQAQVSAGSLRILIAAGVGNLSSLFFDILGVFMWHQRSFRLVSVRSNQPLIEEMGYTAKDGIGPIEWTT